jgi:hypothetical protein
MHHFLAGKSTSAAHHSFIACALIYLYRLPLPPSLSLSLARAIFLRNLTIYAAMTKEPLQSNLDVDYVISYKVDKKGELFQLKANTTIDSNR